MDKAAKYYEKAFVINEALGRQGGMASLCGNLGDVYVFRGELDKAIKSRARSIEIYKTV